MERMANKINFMEMHNNNNFQENYIENILT